LGNLSPMAARISSSPLPSCPLAAAKPLRSGTVSRSHTMTLAAMLHIQSCWVLITSPRFRCTRRFHSSPGRKPESCFLGSIHLGSDPPKRPRAADDLLGDAGERAAHQVETAIERRTAPRRED